MIASSLKEIKMQFLNVKIILAQPIMNTYFELNTGDSK